MKRLIIFVSQFENSLEGANKIKKESNVGVEIYQIENFCNENKYDIISNKDTIFFLCASPLINKVAITLNNKGCRIINKDYFIEDFKKKDIQLLLEHNDIKIPRLYTKDIENNNIFPIFCKENMHTGITIQIYNRNSQDRFFEKFNKDEFYLEEPVNIENSKEIKIYYIDGKIYYKNNEKQENRIINKICNDLSRIFNNIEVFSVDFIYNEKEYYLIDFNPSSGFYSTDDGRAAFVDYCRKII